MQGWGEDDDDAFNNDNSDADNDKPEEFFDAQPPLPDDKSAKTVSSFGPKPFSLKKPKDEELDFEALVGSKKKPTGLKGMQTAQKTVVTKKPVVAATKKPASVLGQKKTTTVGKTEVKKGTEWDDESWDAWGT